MVVGATPELLLKDGFRPVGKDFPVFLHPHTHEEYALARTERKTAPGYHGFQVHAAADVTLEDDLRRRDLTINAMARDAENRLIDPWSGARDLEQRWLRHVSPAFAEDPVRILRIAACLPVPAMRHWAFESRRKRWILMQRGWSPAVKSIIWWRSGCGRSSARSGRGAAGTLY